MKDKDMEEQKRKGIWVEPVLENEEENKEDNLADISDNSIAEPLTETEFRIDDTETGLKTQDLKSAEKEGSEIKSY